MCRWWSRCATTCTSSTSASCWPKESRRRSSAIPKWWPPTLEARPVTLLEVRNLRTGYGQVPVLHGVDLRVDEGETAVLLGLNGAGKTTTLITIAGILRRWG